MARNCYIDGYYLSANGAMLSPEEARWVLRAQPYSSQTGYLILVDGQRVAQPFLQEVPEHGIFFIIGSVHQVSRLLQQSEVNLQ